MSSAGDAVTDSQPAVWTLLDKWYAKSDNGGHLLATLQRYTSPPWQCREPGNTGVSPAGTLAEELYLEAETKLVSIFAFMAHCESAATYSCKVDSTRVRAGSHDSCGHHTQSTAHPYPASVSCAA